MRVSTQSKSIFAFITPAYKRALSQPTHCLGRNFYRQLSHLLTLAHCGSGCLQREASGCRRGETSGCLRATEGLGCLGSPASLRRRRHNFILEPVPAVAGVPRRLVRILNQPSPAGARRAFAVPSWNLQHVLRAARTARVCASNGADEHPCCGPYRSTGDLWSISGRGATFGQHRPRAPRGQRYWSAANCYFTNPTSAIEAQAHLQQQRSRSRESAWFRA